MPRSATLNTLVRVKKYILLLLHALLKSQIVFGFIPKSAPRDELVVQRRVWTIPGLMTGR